MDTNGYVGEWFDTNTVPMLEEVWETHDAIDRCPNDFDFTLEEMYAKASELMGVSVQLIKIGVAEIDMMVQM
jgi:hypothetical protein